MKYLGIHKVLLFIVIIAFTMFEFVFIYLLINICNFLWCFKWNTTWESLITYETYNAKEHCLQNIPYGDKNVLQTIKRRFNWFFRKK